MSHYKELGKLIIIILDCGCTLICLSNLPSFLDNMFPRSNYYYPISIIPSYYQTSAFFHLYVLHNSVIFCLFPPEVLTFCMQPLFTKQIPLHPSPCHIWADTGKLSLCYEVLDVVLFNKNLMKGPPILFFATSTSS